MISIVIPCWNDCDALAAMVRRITAFGRGDQVIVADASDTDCCRTLAQGLGAEVVTVGVPNRGRQLNAGAALARCEMILFHHADTELTAAHLASIDTIARDPEVVGGAFYRRFDPAHRRRQWLVPWVRRFNRWGGTLWGDQSVFVRRAHFERLGGFADIPLMEDVEFSRRLRRSGKIALLDPPVLSSARRHRVYGPLRVTLENMAVVAAYRCGVGPATLHAWYYRRQRHGTPPEPVNAPPAAIPDSTSGDPVAPGATDLPPQS